MITSLDNKKIKEIVKLKNKKYRDSTGLFIIETPNLIEEAYKNKLLVEVYIKDSFEYKINCDSYIVTESVMNKISSLKTTNVLGICKKKTTNDLVGNKYLLLDSIQDPGNLGTIIRSALAFNVDTIVLSLDSVDLYNEKVTRASEGAIFHINIIRKDLKDTIKKLKQKNIVVYGTDVKKGLDIKKINNNNSYALIVGNEGNGVNKELKELFDYNLNIKVNNNLESLNVAIATSILLYEFNKESV